MTDNATVFGVSSTCFGTSINTYFSSRKMHIQCTVTFRFFFINNKSIITLTEVRARKSILILLQGTGDGDCLFNSVSILLVGDESRSLELRYRCLKENTSNYSGIDRRTADSPDTGISW